MAKDIGLGVSLPSVLGALDAIRGSEISEAWFISAPVVG
jgi:hypothetical protein